MRTKEKIKEQIVEHQRMLKYWENSKSSFRKEAVKELKSEIRILKWVIADED